VKLKTVSNIKNIGFNPVPPNKVEQDKKRYKRKKKHKEADNESIYGRIVEPKD